MRKYYTTFILALSLLIGEVHTFWEKSTVVQSWIITRSVPMTIAWNVKMVECQVWYILVFVAMLFYHPNTVNKTTVITFLLFSVMDTLMYFYNYKTYGYGATYIFIGFVWFIIFKYKTAKLRQ